MIDRRLLLAAAAIFALDGTAVAQQPPAAKPQSLSQTDMNFVKEAAIGGQFEIEMGRVAERNAANDKVKQFRAQMVRNHSDAAAKLKTIATAKGATVPQELDQAHAQKRDKLMNLKGAQFDRAYMTEMVKDHDTAAQLFGQQADKGTDADLKQFARTTLPIIQEHNKMAREIAGSLSAAGTSAPAR
jgi:putative membrane protein